MLAHVEASPHAGSGLGTKRRALSVAAAIAYWTTIVSLSTAYAVLRRGYEYKWTNLYVDVPLVLIGTFVSLVLVSGLRRITRDRFIVQIMSAAALVCVAALVYETLWEFALTALPRSTPFEPSFRLIIVGSLFWLAPMGLWAAGHLALFHYAEARRRERRLVALQVEAHEAQVRALRYQVNPHFLYNTLNSIAALILDKRNEEAEHMVLRLADFFRASLALDPIQDVTLAEEIAVQLRYLEVEQLRFGSELSLDVNVPQELEQASLPSLILQPLVENALKHSAQDGGEKLKLRIAAFLENGSLTVEVQDNGVAGARASPGTGTGLKNVANRLSSRFGDNARVDTITTEAGYLARLTMPLEVKK